MMKKYVSKAVAAAMAVTMMVPMVCTSVMAATTTTTKTGTTESTSASADIKYNVTQGYEWTIHVDIDFGKDAGVSKTVVKNQNTVSVSKNIIPDGKKLNITVKGNGSNGEYQIANGSTILSYTIKENDKEIKSGDKVISLEAGTNAESKDLTFTLTTGTGTAEVAGSYSGTVTYTAAIEGADE